MPVVNFNRNGAFHVEPPPPKPRIERQRREPTKEVKRIMPTEVMGYSYMFYMYSALLARRLILFKWKEVPLLLLQIEKESGIH